MLLEWLRGSPDKPYTAHFSAVPTKTAPMKLYCWNSLLVVEFAGDTLLLSGEEDWTLTTTIRRLRSGGYCVEAVTCAFGKTIPPSGSEPPPTTLKESERMVFGRPASEATADDRIGF